MTDLSLIDGLTSGFADPVGEAQGAFRAVLTALSRPGRVVTLARPATAPTGLSPAAASVIATLCDLDTEVWLDPSVTTGAVEAFVAGNCGAPLAARAERAAFAVVGAASLLPLDRFAPGTDAYPDRSTTVIVEVADIGTGEVLSLHGPGIDGQATLALDGLPAGFAAAWRDQRALFPLGVDLVFCAGARLAALPRSTRLA